MESDLSGDRVEPIKVIRGFPVPANPIYKEVNTESAMEYKAQDDDVVLVAYPKTGSTWLQAILWLLLNKGQPPYDVSKVPRIEREGSGAVEAMAKPRFYKHHLPFDYININDKAKYVYIHRRPDDTFVSYYHFSVEMNNREIDFESFFDKFMKGQVPFGNYFDHVLSAYERRHEKYLHSVSYEDLKKDTRTEVLKLAKFLGDEYVSAVTVNNEALLQDILYRTSFEYMKKNCAYVKPVREGILKSINFYRRGVVGDGRKSLLPHQIDQLKEVVCKRMKGTEFELIWDF